MPPFGQPLDRLPASPLPPAARADGDGPGVVSTGHEPPMLPTGFREIIGITQSAESPTSRRHRAIDGSARHVDSTPMVPRQGHRDIVRTPARQGLTAWRHAAATLDYGDLDFTRTSSTGLGRSDRRAAPVREGCLPYSLGRRNWHGTWSGEPRRLRLRCSRSHIPGSPMHPGGNHLTRSGDGFSVIRPLWSSGRISAPSRLEEAYGCRPPRR